MTKRTRCLLLLTISVIVQCTLRGSDKVTTNDIVVTATTSKQGNSFNIPPSFIHRMEVAHNAARNRFLETNIDSEELFASDGRGGKFPNIHIIAARPRSEMKFCYDRKNEEEREELWPFDVEEFEKSLEAKLVRDNEGVFRLKSNFVQDAGPTNGNGLVASYPTIRWVNHEIEQWAIRQLDNRFKRMD